MNFEQNPFGPTEEIKEIDFSHEDYSFKKWNTMLVPPHQYLQPTRFDHNFWKRVHSDVLMEFDSFMEPEMITPIEEHHHEYHNEEEIFMEAWKDAFNSYDVEMSDERSYGGLF